MGLNLHYNLLNYTKYPTELITLLSYKKNLNAKHNIYIVLLRGTIKYIIMIIVGPKELVTPAHFISNSWPMPRKKKCPRTNKKNPDRQGVMPRTTLSSADQDHERGRCHATKESLLERPNGKPKCHGSAIGAWRRSDPRKGHHLHIKYPQLTSWPN